MPVNFVIALVFDTNPSSGHSCNNSMHCLEKNASLHKSAKTPILLVYCSSSPNLSLSSVSAPSMHCFTLLCITVCTIALPLLRMLTSTDVPIPAASKTQDYSTHPDTAAEILSTEHPLGPSSTPPTSASNLQLKHYSCFQTSCSLCCSAAAHK